MAVHRADALCCHVPAEGQQNELVVLGEKGRAQLAYETVPPYIKETIADTQKVRITFSQVRHTFTLLHISPRPAPSQDCRAQHSAW